MKAFRRILRAAVLTLLMIAVVLPSALFIVLSTPWAREQIRTIAQDQLSTTLGVDVRIDDVRYHPFNTLWVGGIHVDDDSGHPALEVAALSARFELVYFLRKGRLVFDYVVLEGPQVALSRTTPGAPLNIDAILKRLKSGDQNKPKQQFDLKIGTVVVRDGSLSYNVDSVPYKQAGLDVNHLKVSDINLYAYLRHAGPNGMDVNIETMSLTEKCGLTLSDLRLDAKVTSDTVRVRELYVELPHSSIEFNPISLSVKEYGGNITKALESESIEISTRGDATLAASDFAWLWAPLAGIDRTLLVDIDVLVSLRRARLKTLSVTDENGFDMRLMASVANLDKREHLEAKIDRIWANIQGYDLSEILRSISPDAAVYAARCGRVVLHGDASATLSSAEANLVVETLGGDIDVRGRVKASGNDWKSPAFDGDIDINNIDAGKLLAVNELGMVSAEIGGSGRVVGRELTAEGNVEISRVDYQGYSYQDIALQGEWNGSDGEVRIESDDPNVRFEAVISAHQSGRRTGCTLDLDLAAFNPNALRLTDKYKDYVMSGKLATDFVMTSVDDIEGRLGVDNFVYSVPDKAQMPALRLKHLDIVADKSEVPNMITITSDWLNGTIEGDVTPSTLPAVLRDMVSHVIPDILPHDPVLHKRLETRLEDGNDFAIDLTLENAESLSHFFNLPVHVIYPVEITGEVSSTRGVALLSIDAPYLQQGDKIIDSTLLSAALNAHEGMASVYASTHMPTKKGPMTLLMGINGVENVFDTAIDWSIDRKIPMNGQINFTTTLGRGIDNDICADTRFSPGEITFGDDVWDIATSSIKWCGGCLDFDGFCLTAGEQRISIDGVAGKEMDDSLNVALNKIRLASIFETLEIDKALIGGTATGTFTARQVLSNVPILSTDNLHVDDIGYNYCVLGNADIRAGWDNERMSFWLDADVVNPEGQHSRISGDIFPTTESLDLDFDARHIKVGFMKPFMEAFASDVEGYVSGRARLFGTFKDIDMTGEVYAEDLRLKIDFTNTWYSATDSIHISPGRIDLNDITIKDIYGHTAKLNGYLEHDFFHNPVFDFRVTDAVDFLSYDVTSRLNPDWYGTIFGNGSAHVIGMPGLIRIGVDMKTAAGSVFTFVLSDRLEAEQYSFITFRDRTEITVDESARAIDDIPEIVKEYQARMQAANEDEASTYLMDIRVDITPEAQMILVMDPVGGDRIRAYGEGDLRMTYNSSDNDLRMYGTYTLERGDYNFTLQDIIIKDFTINRGSSITFRGDPYSAQLDIEAIYAVNANLSDLDESFLQDKDLNRTNVPVHAVLKVTGDMRQPDLAFDLAFPSLTSDVYRKVRSIISTDEMMNRQIIYLLALNRFYTPDYMASTTKGNEIFSVASSTLSSQLSSMLGKLSDNWSIAPNLRSDRGDFSDLEVDVALSSRLLNNRLLFNGNFGYRDRSLNTNQFIGDFDIEYLLTPRGTWRLKAYNRYNDQNYYVRSAATTQGVGIIFRKDFDTLFPSHEKDDEPTDSVTETPVIK